MSRGEKREEPRRLTAALAKFLEMPEGAVADVPSVELRGNSEAIVDGCKGVLEYDDTLVRLSTGRMVIRITGRNLRLRSMAAESTLISGFIQTVEFMS